VLCFSLLLDLYFSFGHVFLHIKTTLFFRFGLFGLQWQWTWKVVEKGKDFVVQFPSVEKLKMMMEFDEFKLLGCLVY
jgi:hypothetical protein